MVKNFHYSKRINKLVGKANAEYSLITEGDRVLIGLSGGKDSFVLLHMLDRMKKIAPFDFEFTAITIDSMTGIDYSVLKDHCDKFGIEYIRYETPIFDILKEKKRENSSACGFCARMRRGAFYSKALELGYNKIALGHHLDDAIETFFMGFFYNGMMRSMPPKYKAYNGIEVIRPLILVRERYIQYMSDENKFPIIDAEGSCLAIQEGDKKQPFVREKIKGFLKDLELEYKDVFTSMEAGFKNISPETFLDRKFLDE